MVRAERAVTSDGVERELKFPCDDLDAVRSRLAELGAERESTSALEDNLVFDRDGELAAAGCLLRLRSDQRGARLTFKGPASFEGTTKLRQEIETEVGGVEPMHELLRGLGYRLAYRYQKMREEWRLGGVVVSLDHTPIGDYVEFEGGEAERVASRCRFDPARAEPRTYYRLYHDYRRQHPEAPREMLFD